MLFKYEYKENKFSLFSFLSIYFFFNNHYNKKECVIFFHKKENQAFKNYAIIGIMEKRSKYG